MLATIATKLQTTRAIAKNKELWSMAWLDSRFRDHCANLTATGREPSSLNGHVHLERTCRVFRFHVTSARSSCSQDQCWPRFLYPLDRFCANNHRPRWYSGLHHRERWRCLRHQEPLSFRKHKLYDCEIRFPRALYVCFLFLT